MSADLLREAAAMMREDYPVPDPCDCGNCGVSDEEDAVRFPRAVADWLDVVAGYGKPAPGRGTRNWIAAVTVARAYLDRGES